MRKVAYSQIYDREEPFFCWHYAGGAGQLPVPVTGRGPGRVPVRGLGTESYMASNVVKA